MDTSNFANSANIAIELFTPEVTGQDHTQATTADEMASELERARLLIPDLESREGAFFSAALACIEHGHWRRAGLHLKRVTHPVARATLEQLIAHGKGAVGGQ